MSLTDLGNDEEIDVEATAALIKSKLEENAPMIKAEAKVAFKAFEKDFESAGKKIFDALVADDDESALKILGF